MPHGMSTITHFIPTYTSHISTRFSGNGQLPIARPGLEPKPSHGTPSAHAKQQALKTKMYI